MSQNVDGDEKKHICTAVSRCQKVQRADKGAQVAFRLSESTPASAEVQQREPDVARAQIRGVIAHPAVLF